MQPLTGVRVLDLGSFVTAPMAAMMLGDLGADVVKVERRTGDPFRTFSGGVSGAQYRAFNRNKKSVTLDFTKPAGRRVLEELVETADILVENFRPGFMDKLGLGHGALAKINPRLIQCSVTGVGPSGPYVKRPSYDTVGQALSGLLSLYLDPADSRLMGTSLSDSITGMYACQAILGALALRERTGRGTHVETNQLAATTALVENWLVDFFLNGIVTDAFRKSAVNTSFALRCSDGKLVAVHLSSPPKFWNGLLAAIGKPELAGDPRFAQRPNRNRHYEELRAELGVIFARHPRSYWLAKLEENDVPFAPIYALDEVADDPQVKAMALFADLVHPTDGTTRIVGRPIWYDGDRGLEGATPPPLLGEQTAEVLTTLNYSTADIARLRAEEII